MDTVIIDNNRVIYNGMPVDTNGLSGCEMLTHLYKVRKTAYPKFYKMDSLCRLGFIGAELLLDQDARKISDVPDPFHAVVVIGHAGSMSNDCNFQHTIADAKEYYPSPAIFVYTLANIVTGEIAIRHKLRGESSSFILDRYNPEMITNLMFSTLADDKVEMITGGWIDYEPNGNMSLRFVNIDRTTTHSQLIDFLETNQLLYQL